jgi:hypothetical protein
LESAPTDSFEPPVAQWLSPTGSAVIVLRLLLPLGPTWFQHRAFSDDEQLCVPLSTRNSLE